MPELPDVEVFAGYLKKNALRRKIQSVEVKTAKILKNTSVKKLQAALKERSFRSVKRVGKYLFVQIEKEKVLVLHFGMTGFVYVFKDENPYDAHTRVLFHFKEKTLAYVNQRKLGFVALADSAKKFTEKLGPDALEISKKAFKELFDRGSLKGILMDQHKIAGIGNVYCDEILFHAHLAPKRSASSLSDKQIDTLYTTMKRVLKRAVEAGADIQKMPAAWLIQARKKGSPCPRCKTPIRQIKASGRSTYYCPKCQKENGK